MSGVEQQVEASIKLEGAEVVAHTAEEDPDVGVRNFSLFSTILFTLLTDL